MATWFPRAEHVGGDLLTPMLRLLVGFVLLALLPGGGAGSTACDAVAMAKAAAGFRRALAERDTAALLLVVPDEAPLHLTTTIEEPWQSDVIPRHRLEAELAAHVGAYVVLMEGTPDDDLRDLLAALPEGPWVETEPALFTPPDGDGRVFLRLVCENGSPKVTEVGWPAS